MTADHRAQVAASSVVAGGHRLCVWRAGSGRPVLLIHGIPTSSLLWRHVQPQLIPHADVVAVDLLGYGESLELLGPAPSGTAGNAMSSHDDQRTPGRWEPENSLTPGLGPLPPIYVPRSRPPRREVLPGRLRALARRVLGRDHEPRQAYADDSEQNIERHS